MSGLEVFGLVVNIISVTKTIIEVYGAIENLHGLPEAFHEVNKRLPLVAKTLRDMKTQAKNIQSPEEGTPIVTILKSSQGKAKELDTIFNEIAKKSKDNFVVSVYKVVIAKIGKKGRVETLMDGILKDLSVLVTYQVFQMSAQKHDEDLKKARNELAEVPPSLPDSEFDEKGGSATQIGGRDQHNIWGDNAKMILGSNFESARDQIFGLLAKYLIYITNQSTSRLDDVKSPSRYRKYLENLDKHKQVTEILPVEKRWGDLNDTESVLRHARFVSSFQALISENKESATHVLMLSASFGIGSIREPFFSMYYAASKERPPWLEQLGKESLWDSGSFQSTIEDLHTRGLVQRSQKDSQDIPDGVCYSIHPDIRAWLRMRPESSQEDYAFEAVSLLFAYIRASENDPIPLPIQPQVLTHLDFCLSDQAVEKRVISKSACEVASRSVAICFAKFYRKCSRFKDSKRLLTEVRIHADSGNIENSLAILDMHLELGDTLRDNYEYGKAEREYLAVGKFVDTLDNERRCRYLIGLGDSNRGLFNAREARTFGREALVFTEDIRLQTEASILVANAEGALGNFREAGKIIRNAYDEAKEKNKLGPEDNLTLKASITVAYDLMTKRETVEEAKRTIERTLAISEARNGPDHRLTLDAMSILGGIYGRTHHYEEARNWFSLVKARSETLFRDTPSDAKLELEIAFSYSAEKIYDKAETHFKKALEKAQESEDESVLGEVSGNLFLFYLNQYRFMEAIPLFLYFARTFPFASFLRYHQGILFLGAVFLLLLLLSGLRGYLVTVIVISAVVCVTGLMFLAIMS